MDAMGLWIEKLEEDSGTKKNQLACGVTSGFRKDLKCWGHFSNIRIPSVTKTHWKSATTTDFTASHKVLEVFFFRKHVQTCTWWNLHRECPFDGGVDISNENGPKYVDITDIHLWCSYQNKHEIACHQPTLCLVFLSLLFLLWKAHH